MSDAQTPTRKARSQQNRETSERPKTYTPPSVLPVPEKQDGYRYRWVRTEMLGQSDDRNVSMRRDEGWIEVKPEEVPELALRPDRNSKYADMVMVQGLILCKMPEELAASRDEYYGKMNRQQIQSVNENYLSDQNPAMQKFSDNKTSVSFGSGGGK